MVRGNRPEEIAQAEATARAQQAAFEAARNGPRQQEIDQAQADYAAASADAANAEVTLQAHGKAGRDRHHLAPAVRRRARQTRCGGAAGGVGAAAAGAAAGGHAR